MNRSRKRQQKGAAKVKPTSRILVYCDPRLKERAGPIAEQRDLSLSELTALALAAFIGEPELGKVPRKPMGRPRKQVSLDPVPA